MLTEFVKQKPSFFSLNVPSDSTDGSFSNFRSDSLPMQRFQALSSINQTLIHKRTHSSGLVYPNNLSLEAEMSNMTNIRPADNSSHVSHTTSFRGLLADNSSRDQLASTSETSASDQVMYHFR